MHIIKLKAWYNKIPEIKGKIRLNGKCSILVAVSFEIFSRYDIYINLIDIKIGGFVITRIR